MNAEERLRWTEAQIVAGELRITRQLEVIRHWRLLGQDTARLEQLLSDMERVLQRWHRLAGFSWRAWAGRTRLARSPHRTGRRFHNTGYRYVDGMGPVVR